MLDLQPVSVPFLIKTNIYIALMGWIAMNFSSVKSFSIQLSRVKRATEKMPKGRENTAKSLLYQRQTKGNFKRKVVINVQV